MLDFGVLVACLACAGVSEGTGETSLSLKLEVTGCVDLVLNELHESSVPMSCLEKFAAGGLGKFK